MPVLDNGYNSVGNPAFRIPLSILKETDPQSSLNLLKQANPMASWNSLYNVTTNTIGIPNVSIEGGLSQRRYSNSRVVSSGRPDFRLNKFSQMGIPSQFNSPSPGINLTPPDFYGPQHTVSAWQIPSGRREVISWCKHFYENQPMVGTGIDFYAQFSMNGFKLECPDPGIRKVFEKLCEDLNLETILPQIAHEYFLFGDCFPMLDLKCDKCKGTGIDPKTNAYCDHEGATWQSITILDPNIINVSQFTLLNQEPMITMMPPPELVEVCMKQQPKHIYDQIPEEIRQLMRTGRPILLNNLAVTHFKHGAPPYQVYGIPLIKRLFPTLAYQDKMRQGQWMVVDRHIVPIKLIKVGDQNRPASEEDIADIQNQAAMTALDPLLTMVTHHAVDIEWVGANGKVLQLTQEYEITIEEIQAGFQMNKALFIGEGPNASGALIGVEALASRLEAFRNMMAKWIEQKIFKPIAIWNNYTNKDPRGIEELVIPKVKFNDMSLRDNSNRQQKMLDMRKAGDLSAFTLYEEFGIDYNIEIERIREEELGNLLTDPSSGLGVREGGDIGGGGDLGMGSVSAPAPEGGELGDSEAAAPPPGMPPEGGGSAESAMEQSSAIPATASFTDTHRENYRHASIDYSVVLADAAERIHRDNSVLPVIGVGGRGLLPPELDENIGEPIRIGKDVALWTNYICGYLDKETERNIVFKDQAIREAKKKKGREQEETIIPAAMFTKPEVNMYKGIKSLNLKPAFFAQYTVGGNKTFRVDGAFPTVMVAVEVDGNEWHSNPEKVAKDQRRDAQLQAAGWIVLRFTEDEVNMRNQEVLDVISKVVAARLSGG